MDLSIIIACSRPKSVRNCLRGLEAQTGNFQFEVLVIGLVDDLRDQIFQLDCRLFVCNESHPNVRRNIGLENAKSQVIAFLDDDTIPDRDWVSMAIRYSDPEKNIVLAGVERPFANKNFADIVFKVSKSILSEGTRGHINRKFEKVSWTNVYFCNCVIPMKLISEVGGLAVDIPWDMDDTEFFIRLKKKAMFLNIPQLSILHNRYPDSLLDLVRYKWRLRLSTGEKLITHPSIYWRVTPVAAAAILPVAGLLLLCFSPMSATLLFSIYIALVLCQIPMAIYMAKGSFLLYLQIMTTIHVITIAGIQVGMVRAMSQRLTHRKRPKMESGWISFWDEPDIYRKKLESNIRSKYSKIIFGRFLRLLEDRTHNNILDFGCGDAAIANCIVEAGHNLFLYDASRYYLTRAREKFLDHQHITVVSQDDYKIIPDESIDVVVVLSVTQYLGSDQLKAQIKRWAKLLKNGGIVVLADVVAPSSSIIRDTLSLFFSSIKYNFVIGFFYLISFHLTSSRYRDLRKSLNLYKYSRNDFEEYASPLGLRVSEHHENLGLSSERKTFILTK